MSQPHLVVHDPRVGPRSRGRCCSARWRGDWCCRSGPSGGRVRRGRSTSTASSAGSRSCSSASTCRAAVRHLRRLLARPTCSCPWRRTGARARSRSASSGCISSVAVEVTSLFMRRLPRRVWHSIHLLSLVALVLVTVHAFTAGADACSPLVVALAVMSSAVVDRARRRARACTSALDRLRSTVRPPLPDPVAVRGRRRRDRVGGHRRPAAPRPAPPLRPGRDPLFLHRATGLEEEAPPLRDPARTAGPPAPEPEPERASLPSMSTSRKRRQRRLRTATYQRIPADTDERGTRWPTSCSRA